MAGVLCMLLTGPAVLTAQGAVRAVIAQRRLQVLVEQIQAGKLEPKSLLQTHDDGIRWARRQAQPGR